MIKTFRPTLNTTYIKTISPFIGVDYGYVNCQDTNEPACGDLAGAAIGFKTESQMISTEFTFSRAIKKVEHLAIETLFRYNINLKF